MKPFFSISEIEFQIHMRNRYSVHMDYWYNLRLTQRHFMFMKDVRVADSPPNENSPLLA
jgi:hypothetical protein